MLSFMIAAPASGTGKTAVTCGLLELLNRKGYAPCAFKCGPDYIDPMFHRSVLGVESHNLDLFLSDEKTVRRLFERYRTGHGAVVCEGVMGYYDGLGGTTARASAWHVADTLGMKTILVLRPKGASLTLAAQIRGLAEFDANLTGTEPENCEALEKALKVQTAQRCAGETGKDETEEEKIRKEETGEEETRKEETGNPGHIAGVILNDCSGMLYQTLAPMLEKRTGIPVLGYLPHMEEAAFESRHLGLHTAGEIRDLKERIGRIADQMEESIDFLRLKELFSMHVSEGSASVSDGSVHVSDNSISVSDDSVSDFDNSVCEPEDDRIRIAVARDEAFCFFYHEGIDLLIDAGAQIIWFSPLHDDRLPDGIQGLYLTGGYPELYVRELSENRRMRESVKDAVLAGLPTIAECGGFLYLGQKLADEKGDFCPQAGVLPGSAEKKNRLVRFGYSHLRAEEDSLLFRAGESVPVHEFHYWDSTDNGDALTAVKPLTGRRWKCGFTSDSLYAGFPHLYFAGNPRLADRFIRAAKRYGNKNTAVSSGRCYRQ